MYIPPNEPDTLYQAINILRYLLAAFFIFASFKSFRANQQMKDDFKRWGYSTKFRYLIALVQIAGGLCLLVPALSFWAGITLIVLMIGAIYTHLKHDPPKSSLAAVIFFILLTLVSCQFTPVLSSQKTLYNRAQTANIQSCQACHQNEQIAPRLEGLDFNYMSEQIANFKNAKRGFHEADLKGKSMAMAVKGVKETELNDILVYYATQEKIKTKTTISGDLSKGKELYLANCKGCHGSPIGRFFTKSPKINHLQDHYVFSQLKSFKDGYRLSSDGGKHKEKMIVVAKRFNEQQMKDITAYINSLSDKEAVVEPVLPAPSAFINDSSSGKWIFLSPSKL